jgi:transposase
MAEAHPIALRERVVEAYESGEGSYVALAGRFSIGEATVKRWVWLQRRTGAVAPQAKGGGTPSQIGAADLETLLSSVADATAGELTTAFNRGRAKAQRIHVSSMKRALHRHGYVVKKSADGRWKVCAPTLSSGARPS